MERSDILMRMLSPKLRYSLAVAVLAVAAMAVAAVVTDGPTFLSAQTAEPSVMEQTDAAVATEVEIQQRFNELRGELLDDRSDTVEWWLTATAIFVTLFGVGIALLGILGFSRFQAEARQHVGAAEKSAAQAAVYLERIKENLDQSERLVDRMTSKLASSLPTDPSFASRVADPDEVERIRKAVQAVRSNPDAPFLEKVIADAYILQRGGKISEATGKWRAIANIAEGTDNDLAARAWFSVGYLSEGEQAIDSYDKAIGLKSDYADAYNDRGIVKGSLRQNQDAIADFDQAILLKPDYGEAFNNRGVAKGILKLHEDALADFDQAIRLSPDDARAYFNRGRAKVALHQNEDAIANFDQAIRLNPNYSEAYNNRGNVKGILGHSEDAIADFDQAIRLNPGHALAYNNRGNAKRNLKRHAEANIDFDQAIRLNPDEVGSYVNRGGAKWELGDVEGARSDFQTALDLAAKAGNDELKAVIERQLQGLEDTGQE